MKKNYNIVVSKFNFENLKIIDLYNLLISSEYTNENGFGFRNIVFDSNILHGTLLRKSLTFIDEYDIENDIFEKKPIALFKEVDFIINYNTNIITVFGSATNSNKLKSSFRNIFNQIDYQLSNLDLTSFAIYQKLKQDDQQSTYKIEDITIRNFKYKDGATGRFVSKILNQNIASELLEIYQNDVVRIKILLDDRLSVSIQNNGAFTISCNEDEIDGDIDFINNLIM
jgi:hypothetical protein